MDLEKIGKRSGRGDHPDASAQLKFLLQGAQAWQQIDRLVKQELPANLHPYIQTACISEGCLVLLAANGMAASRAKMLVPGLLPRLQRHTDLIRDIKVKTVPKTPPPQKINKLELSPAALESFRQSAERLQHHPKLAAALRNLVNKRQK